MPPDTLTRVLTTCAARRAPARIAELIAEPRPLHRLIARHSGPRGPIRRPGQFRTDGQGMAVRGFMGDAQTRCDLCSGARVAGDMAAFAEDMRRALDAPQDYGPADALLAAIFARLCLIHPFSDGNGRVARAAVLLAAPLLGLRLAPTWQVERRAYGSGMSVSLQAWVHTDRPLRQYLGRFLT